MKMYSRKKKVPVSPNVSPTTPVRTGFQSRPFVVQARPVQVSSPDQQRAALQTKLEKAARFGHNLEHIKLSTQSVIQPQQVRPSPENKPAINPTPSNGQSMPGLVQGKMEAAFGTNLSDDQVHKRPEAKQIAVLAYTQGSNIHFQPGKSQPTTQPGQMQQRARRVAMPQSPIIPINADPKLEAEADALGAKAAQGESVQVSGAASSGVQRQPAQGDVMQCVEREGRVTASSSLQEEEIKTSDDEESISDILAQFPMPPASPTPQESPYRPLERSARTSRYAPSRQQRLETIEEEPEHGATEVDDQESILNREIARLEGNVKPLPPEKQPGAYRRFVSKAASTISYPVRKPIAIASNRIIEPLVHGVTGKPGNEFKKQAAGAIKEHEAYSDAAKNLGKGSTAHGYSYSEFGEDAAVIGDSRDDAKAVGGWLTLSDSLKKFKGAWNGKKKTTKDRISEGADAASAIDSTGTYTGIVTDEIIKGVNGGKASLPGHTVSEAIHSGALSAAEAGGSGLGFDIGKGFASDVGLVPKGIKYWDATKGAIENKKYKKYKSWGRGIKNAADFGRSAAGAVKDTAGLAGTIAKGSHDAAAAAGTEAVKHVAGGGVAPGLNAVFGGVEMIQGGYKANKVRKNYQLLDELKPAIGLSSNREDTLKDLKGILKKKGKRAAMTTALGAASTSGGIAALAGGPAGLVAGTAIGASVGAVKLGQWGAREFKQSMRDKKAKLQEQEEKGENTSKVKKVLLTGFNAEKSTDKKGAKNKELAGHVHDMLGTMNSQEHQDQLLSTIGLGGKKKDSAVQAVYGSVLDKHIESEARKLLEQEPQQIVRDGKVIDSQTLLEEKRNAVKERKDIKILRLKGHKDNLKQEVTWDALPEELKEKVKKEAIAKALKKR